MRPPSVYINPNLNPDQFSKQQQQIWAGSVIGFGGGDGGGGGGGSGD